MKMPSWPVYFAENLILGSENSSVGIATLWTPKEFFSSKLAKNNYRIIGQLYSHDGVNPLLRNILANPTIRTIIVCGLDRISSADTLVKLVKNGINAKWQVIGKEQAQVEKEIPHKAIEEFRRHVKIVDLRGKIKPADVQSHLDGCAQDVTPWSVPQLFPENKISTERFPAEGSAFVYRGNCVAEVWPKILHSIMRFGEVKETNYGKKQRELLNVTVVVREEDPNQLKLIKQFTFTQKEFAEYRPQVLTAQKSPSLTYTYGSRLRDYHGLNQIQEMVDKLRQCIYSRQALATTWQVTNDTKSAHPPCLITLQALVQYGQLHLTAYFRSNDMYRAWPANALVLRLVQYDIAKELHLPLGLLTTITSSAHIYSENFLQAQNVVSELYPHLACEQDPRGNYIIKIGGDKIEVIHQSPDGRPIDKLSGRTAQVLINKIAVREGVSVISHALDLGAELQKAEIALKHGISYTQDRPLNL